MLRQQCLCQRTSGLLQKGSQGRGSSGDRRGSGAKLRSAGLPLLFAAITLTLAGVGLAGCTISGSTNKTTGQEDVKIAMPMGGLEASSGQTTAASLGLAVYPGAKRATNQGDDSSANVRMGWGPWGLSVQTVAYQAPSPASAVEAFYRKQLEQYGTVIACRGSTAVGKPTQTNEGLTCANDQHGVQINLSLSSEQSSSQSSSGHSTNHQVQSFSARESDMGLRLLTGSRNHQIVASFEPNGTGTRFTLYTVDVEDGTMPKPAKAD